MTSTVTIDGVTLTGTMDEIIATLKRSAKRLEIRAAAGADPISSARAARDLRREIRGLELAKKAFRRSV